MRYRIYSTQLNRWIEDLFLPNLCYNLESLTINGLFSQLEENRNVVVQSGTGLRDSEGKEIYEGDIVTALSSDNQYGSIVKWDDEDGRWGFESIKCKNMSYSYNLSYGCSKWKVIGNILENPELLK